MAYINLIINKLIERDLVKRIYSDIVTNNHDVIYLINDWMEIQHLSDDLNEYLEGLLANDTSIIDFSRSYDSLLEIYTYQVLPENERMLKIICLDYIPSLTTISLIYPKIYDHPDKKIDYTIYKHNEKYDEQRNKLICSSITKLVNELQDYYDYYVTNSDSSFICLMRVLSYTEEFLLFSYSDNIYECTMENALNKLNVKERTSYINIKNIFSKNKELEVCKLIIWFIDDFLSNIPILLAKDINIDYYYYTKKNILKL